MRGAEATGGLTTAGRPATSGHFEAITIRTPRGAVEMRLYDAPGDAAVIAVGGIGGGFDSPALGLYDTLGAALQALGTKVLRVKFRQPGDLRGCVEDVLAGAELLRIRGVRRVGLVGHSFGGAVVITAGGLVPEVRTVVTLATQSAGAEASRLGDRSLLLLHGTEDEVLPPDCSVHVQRTARGESALELLPGADHVLDEAAETVRERVQEWLVERLA